MTRSDVIQKNVIIHDAVPTATAIQEDQTYTNEEKNRIIQIYDEIFNSNLIFCPDKEFDQEPDSITTTQIEKLVSELNWIKERASLRQQSENEQKTVSTDERFTFIEKLNVKFETYYALKK